MASYCRLCMKSDNLRMINGSVEEAIRKEFNIVLKQDCRLSKEVCQKCAKFMLKMTNFKKNVREKQKVMRKVVQGKFAELHNVLKNTSSDVSNNVSILLDNKNNSSSYQKRPFDKEIESVKKQTSNSTSAVKRKAEFPASFSNNPKIEKKNLTVRFSDTLTADSSIKMKETSQSELLMNSSSNAVDATIQGTTAENQFLSRFCMGCYAKHLRSPLNVKFEFDTVAEFEKHKREVHSDMQHAENSQAGNNNQPSLCSNSFETEEIAFKKSDSPAIACVKTEPRDYIPATVIKSEPNCVPMISCKLESSIEIDSVADKLNQSVPELKNIFKNPCDTSERLPECYNSEQNNYQCSTTVQISHIAERRLLNSEVNTNEAILQQKLPNKPKCSSTTYCEKVLCNQPSAGATSGLPSQVMNILPAIEPWQGSNQSAEPKTLSKKARRKLMKRLRKAVLAANPDIKPVSAPKSDKVPEIPLVMNENGQLAKPRYAKIYIPCKSHWRCRLCQQRCDVVDQLETHFSECLVRRTCSICKQIFASNGDMILHKSIAHSKQVMSIETYQQKMKRVIRN